MQGWYDARFVREMGCTEADWLRSLPGAVAPHALVVEGRTAHVAIDGGVLMLHWKPLEERRIALMRMPRLAVTFRFENLDDEPRQDFMRRFDLCMQRGGG